MKKIRDVEETNEEVDLETLEKGLDDSLGALSELLGNSPEKLAKAKKKVEEDDEDYDEEEAEEDEEDEHEEPDGDEDEEGEEPQEKKSMHKSIADRIADDDEESALAMDVEPFLKSLTVGIESYIDDKFEELHKSMKKIKELSKAQGRAYMASMELSKALSGSVKQIANQPVNSASILRKGGVNGQRFERQAEPYNKEEVLRKSFELVKNRTIDTVQATIIEHRVNQGADLGEFAHYFEKQAE